MAHFVCIPMVRGMITAGVPGQIGT